MVKVEKQEFLLQTYDRQKQKLTKIEQIMRLEKTKSIKNQRSDYFNSTT